MDRERLLADIQDARSRRPVLGTFDDGWDDFDRSERKRVEVLDDAALKKALTAAHTEVNQSGGEHARRRFKVIRGVFSERLYHLSAVEGWAKNELERNPPPILTAAITRMKAALEFARGLGISQVTLSGVPGGSTMSSARGRTAADEAAAQRIEAALNKLRNLIFVDCDLEQAIAAIVTEADIGAIFTALPATPPPKNAFDKRRDAMKATSISQNVIAELELTPAQREQLLPAG